MCTNNSTICTVNMTMLTVCFSPAVADDSDAVYKVFRSHFDQLVSGITQPVTLAGVLYSRELINRAMNNEIITLPASDADKAAKLMNAVEATMKADPKPARVLSELCEAMEFDNPALKHVADSIEQH